MLELKKIEILKEKMAELLEDEETFCNVCECIDDYEGYPLGDDRCYPMYELDDILYGKSAGDIIDLLNSDFDKYDDFFYWDCYGLHTTDDRFEVYADCTSIREIIRTLVNNRIDIDFCGCDELVEVVDEIHSIQDEMEMLEMFATI